jgi:hypothetical protein
MWREIRDILPPHKHEAGFKKKAIFALLKIKA